MNTIFEPTRVAGLAQLNSFLPNAGRAYASDRNYDLGPDERSNVSMLSPYVRHRLITELDILSAVLARHSFSSAEKYIQEVCWRTYWKGWLELRPDVWRHYCSDVVTLKQQGTYTKFYSKVIAGETSIGCFNAWVEELVQTGYLHNHARMWFASIWIFTLKLPWQLGADFFMTHLVDGDPASNTLSWRWVAGLQTTGKTYLARADNISEYTKGRFEPHGLAHHAEANAELGPTVKPVRLSPMFALPQGKAGLLLTEEDVHSESHDFGSLEIVAVASIPTSPEQSFAAAALDDGLARAGDYFSVPADKVHHFDHASIVAWAKAHGLNTLVTPYAPVGPTQSLLQYCGTALKQHGISLIPIRRGWDEAAWSYCMKGFFAFKEHIPKLLADHVTGQEQ